MARMIDATESASNNSTMPTYITYSVDNHAVRFCFRSSHVGRASPVLTAAVRDSVRHAALERPLYPLGVNLRYILRY